MESDSVEKQVTALVNNLIPDTLPCGVQCKPYLNPSGACNGSRCRKCPHVRKILDVDDHSGCQSPPPRPLPLSLPPPAPRRRPLPLPTAPSEIASPMAANGHHVSQKHVFILSVTVMGCMIGAVLLFCILRKIFRDYRSRRRNLRRTRTAQMSFGGPQEDFFGEDQGPVVDHPIWYINTIGLEQSVIDSIAIFKYKKGEGLIEGTECSVCLNEFQEDESLRLLPKCSHAFHISCIDTWLRSHKNCPLCRAPVVCNNYGAQVGPSVVAGTSDLSPTEEPQIENSVNNSGGFVRNEGGEDGTSEVRNEDSNVCQLPIESDEPIAGNSKVNTIDPSILRNHSRVKSDMVGNSLAVEAEMQSMRRSLSLDFSSASAIYDAVASFSSVKHQGDLNTQLAGLNHSKLKKVARRGSSGNSSFRKLIRSSSIGLSLQMGSLSMKRSLSYSRKSSASRHNRSQDSILPL